MPRYVINPNTGKRIKYGGRYYKSLVKQGVIKHKIKKNKKKDEIPKIRDLSNVQEPKEEVPLDKPQDSSQNLEDANPQDNDEVSSLTEQEDDFDDKVIHAELYNLFRKCAGDQGINDLHEEKLKNSIKNYC
jgi:hypothetical protein